MYRSSHQDYVFRFSLALCSPRDLFARKHFSVGYVLLKDRHGQLLVEGQVTHILPLTKDVQFCDGEYHNYCGQ